MIPPRKSVSRITPYPLLSVSRSDKIRLDLNESTWGCSPKVLDALKNLRISDICFYPEYSDFQQDLATYYGIDSGQIILTNGADDAIRAVMQTYIGEADRVLLMNPSFGMIPIHVRVMGGAIQYINYEKDLQFPFYKLRTALEEGARLTAIVRPDSPTGAIISRENLIELLQKFPQTLFLLDETYHHFIGETCIDLIRQFPNLIVVQSFSKARGLAGLRLGFIASQEENIQQIRKVNPPFATNSVAVIAGAVALKDEAFLKSVLTDVETVKRSLVSELQKLSLPVVSTHANFILLNMQNRADQVHKFLIRKNILVKNLKGEHVLNGYFRVAVGTAEEMERFLTILRNIFQPEALLFDMDGVLVDVSQSYRLAIKTTAEHFLNQPVSLEEVEAFKNMGGYNNDWDCTAAIIEAFGVQAKRQAIIDEFQRKYLGNDFNGYIRNESWLLNPKILQQLQKRFKLGIVTGRPREEALFTLKRFAVEEYFQTLIALEDMGKRQKPDAHGIHLALSKLNANTAYYFGDTIDDVNAALAAGVIPVGVMPPGVVNAEGLKTTLKEAGAFEILTDINSIVEVLP